MSTKNTKTPAPSEDADIEISTPELVESESLELAPTGAAPGTSLARPNVQFDASAFETRIMAAGEALAVAAEQYPDLKDHLLEMQTYAATHIEGLESSRGASVPAANIRQAMTKADKVPDDCKPGMYYSSQGKTLGNTLRLIVLHQHRKRTRFVANSETPECSSNDGKYGSKYGECQACPYSRWDDGAKSECSSGWGITAVLEDFSGVYSFNFAKTAAKTGKTFQRFYQAPATWATVLELSVDKDKNSNGQEYFVPKVKPTGVKVSGGSFAGAAALGALVKAKYDLAVARREAYGATHAIGAGSGKDGNGDLEGTL